MTTPARRAVPRVIPGDARQRVRRPESDLPMTRIPRASPAMAAAVAAAVAAVLVLAPGWAQAQDYPALKAGQWELTTTSSNAPDKPTRTTYCLDATVQKEMAGFGEGMRKEMCSKSTMKRDGNRYVGDSECRLGTTTMRSRSVMTLTGDAAYRTEVKATYDPPFMGMKESTTIVEGRHTGACRDGLVPGDLVTATGQKINVKQLQEMRERRAAAPVAPGAAPGPGPARAPAPAPATPAVK